MLPRMSVDTVRLMFATTFESLRQRRLLNRNVRIIAELTHRESELRGLISKAFGRSFALLPGDQLLDVRLMLLVLDHLQWTNNPTVTEIKDWLSFGKHV